MKVTRLLVILLLAAVLGGLTYYVEQKRSQELSVISGVFENQPTEVAARTAGRVVKIVAKEGTVVKKGQLLLLLDPGPLTTELKSLEAKVRQSRANLRDLQAGARPSEIAKQRAVVEENLATLEKLQNGARPQEIASAQAACEQAQATLEKTLAGPRPEETARAQASLNAAQAQYTFAEIEVKRYRGLFASGAVSRQELDRKEEAFGSAQAQVESAGQLLQECKRGGRPEDIEMARANLEGQRQQLELLQEGSRREDIAAAQARLNQSRQALNLLLEGTRPQQIAGAKAALQTAQLNAQVAREKLAEYKVIAPLDGAVERELVAAGDLTASGQSLMRLVNLQDIWIKVYVSEKRLAHIKVGQTALLKVDGIPELLPAYVESVASRGEYTPVNLQTPEERGNQAYAVRLRLKAFNSAVKAGMAATLKSVGDWQCQ